jgi:hypothetical protein
MLRKTLCVNESDTAAIRRLKESALSKLDKYYADPAEEAFIDLCTYFDPRFRAFPHKVEAKRNVEENVTHILEELVANDSNRLSQPVSEGSSGSDDSSRTPTGLGRLLSPIMMSTTSTSSAQELDTDLTNHEVAVREVARYNALPVVGIETNPLDWWKVQSSALKYLSQLARKYLCIVATSVPSECMFSTAGDIVSARRSRLLPENTHMLCLLHDNSSVGHKHMPQYRRMWTICSCTKCRHLIEETGFDKI